MHAVVEEAHCDNCCIVADDLVDGRGLAGSVHAVADTFAADVEEPVARTGLRIYANVKTFFPSTIKSRSCQNGYL